MQDIAEKLGVSKSTVSLVLSGKADGRVSAQVRQKVTEAAREMNYHVNSVARSLRTGTSQIISVIVTDISNEFFGKLTFHIQEAAKKAGYLVLTINSNENDRDFDEMVDMLIGKKVDGIIVVPTPDGEKTVRRMISHQVPVVMVDRFYDDLDVSYVGVDNYASARDGMESLFKDGYRKIAAIGLDLDIPPLNERLQGYKDVMWEHHLDKFISIQKIPFAENDEAAIDKVMREVRNYDAIFFTSHRVFTRGLASLSRGKGLPKGQCLLCFDDVRPYMISGANIRYIEQPVADIGRRAFELLIDQIRGKHVPTHNVFTARCITR